MEALVPETRSGAELQTKGESGQRAEPQAGKLLRGGQVTAAVNPLSRARLQVSQWADAGADTERGGDQPCIADGQPRTLEEPVGRTGQRGGEADSRQRSNRDCRDLV